MVEEVGPQPAGADPDLATGMLLDFGIATEADLRGRSTARAAYRALVASLDGVQPPRLVRDLLDAWRFAAGHESIDAATQVAGVLSVLEPGWEPDDVKAMGGVQRCRDDRGAAGGAGLTPGRAGNGRPRRHRIQSRAYWSTARSAR